MTTSIEDYEFSNDLGAMMEQVGAWTVRKGWEPDLDRQFGTEIALVTSELSEALEAYREEGFMRYVEIDTKTGNAPTDDTRLGDIQRIEVQSANGYGTHKPLGVPSEFADTLIRILHYCYVHGINLEAEYIAKMRYNETRERRHGGKLA